MVAARYNILYSAEIMLFYTLSARYRLLILLDIGIHRVLYVKKLSPLGWLN